MSKVVEDGIAVQEGRLFVRGTEDRMEACQAISQVNNDAIFSKIDAIQAFMMGLGNLEGQLAAFVQYFSLEI